MNINITVSGIPKTEEKLLKVKEVLDHLEPALTDAAEYVRDYLTNPVFETEGSIDGQPWADLKIGTIMQKNKKYPGRGILQASGVMRDNYQTLVTDESAEIYNPTPYAKYHQEGTTKMVQRKLINIGEQKKGMIIERFRVKVEELVKLALVL